MTSVGMCFFYSTNYSDIGKFITKRGKKSCLPAHYFLHREIIQFQIGNYSSSIANRVEELLEERVKLQTSSKNLDTCCLRTKDS